MAQSLPLTSRPLDSAAVDWLSLSYKFASNDRLDDLYAVSMWMGEQVLPGEPWIGPTAGKHFTRMMRHPSGLSLQFTPWGSAAGVSSRRRNEGAALIEMGGTFLGSFDTKFRQELYSLLGGWPGLHRCTRLDSQITVLDPEVDALAVVLLVEQRKLWPVGYGRGQAYCERTQGGQIVGPVTQYWGAKTSARRARCYDKASEQGWDMPAVRFELQERREAAHAHFLHLAKLSKAEASVGPLLVTAEQRTVRNVLGKELDLRDTSAWADRERPQNWAQYAPTPGWWEKVLGQPVDPIAVQFRPPTDLASTRAAAVEQYGRKLTVENIRRAVVEGTTLDEQARLLQLELAQRVRREDLATVLALLPENLHDQARKVFAKVAAQAARHTEEMVQGDT